MNNVMMIQRSADAVEKMLNPFQINSTYCTVLPVPVQLYLSGLNVAYLGNAIETIDSNITKKNTKSYYIHFICILYDIRVIIAIL